MNNNTALSDFYNNTVSVKYLSNPETLDSYDIKLMDITQYIDDGMNSAGSDINNHSGSGADRCHNIKNHFNACNNNRVIGSYKARKYIFPRQDKKHPGYYEGKHTDIEKLEYLLQIGRKGCEI